MKFGRSEVTVAKIPNPLLERGEVEVELPRLHVEIDRIAGAVARTSHVFDGSVCRIGSHASNELVLDDPTISRFHCRIAREGGGWRVFDTGSTNGTRVGGVRILAAELEGEASIEIGDSRLRVHPAREGEGRSVPVVHAFGAIVGKSVAMQQLFAVLERVAASEIDVLISGESGTGKELVAAELVGRSARADKPLVVVDCGAISPALVESELFGHVRGAFTGADRDREGAFEAADGGTVFLDEVGELPLELQPKLLRALEAREVRRVGTTRQRRVDVRVIAATNRDLEREVNKGRFREDLYYRLAKVSVRVPPLRNRLEDLPLLVRRFLSASAGDHAGTSASRLLSPEVLAELQRHDWPGNIRELKNYVERSIVLDDFSSPRRKSGAMEAVRPRIADDDGGGLDGELAAIALEHQTPFRVAKEQAIAAFEKSYIGPLLEKCAGNVSKAARLARMDRMYLHQLAQKYGLRSIKREA